MDYRDNKGTSHEYAKKLRELADWLESRPEFKLPHGDADRISYHHFMYWQKEDFLDAVRALGTGKKEFVNDDIKFSVDKPFAYICASAPRTTVCRLVRPAEYECDPFLSPEEEKQIGGAA